MWGSQAFVGSDYPATHSTSGILQGEDQEMPTQNGFFAGGNGTGRPDRQHVRVLHRQPGRLHGRPVGPGLHERLEPRRRSAERLPGRQRRGRLPGARPPRPAAGGCTLNAAVVERRPAALGASTSRWPGSSTRSSASGCSAATRSRRRPARTPAASAADRTGTAPLPLGGDGQLGTKYGDAAIVEKYSEEGATLLKNDGNALPLTASDLAGGILVTGSSANHTVADPTNEASTGFIDRDAVNPLEQLKQFSGNPNAFTFVPANDPTGQPVPCLVTNHSSPTGAAPAAAPPAACNATSGLQRASGATVATVATDQVDQKVDYTTASTAGQLAGSKAYQWSGWVYVPDRRHVPVGAAVQRAERERHVRLRQQREPGDRRARHAHAGERAEHLRRDDARARRRTPATRRRC